MKRLIPFLVWLPAVLSWLWVARRAGVYCFFLKHKTEHMGRFQIAEAGAIIDLVQCKRCRRFQRTPVE